MPSVRDQSKLSQPSLLVYANISGMPAIALECLLLSPVLNCREVERMQKTQASSLDTGHLTRREGLPVHGRVCTRAHAHTHTHTASQAESVGRIRPTGSRPNPDSATCNLGGYFTPSKSQVSHVQCPPVQAHPTELL